MDAVTMPIDEAQRLVAEWEGDEHHGRACDFYWPGAFDLRLGERRCHRCRVPERTHRAYRVLNRSLMTHGA